MDTIQITENKNEMLEIGKKLYLEKREKYKEALVAIIRRFIKSRIPDATDKEIDDYFYLTVYHYWVYGCTYEECMNYDFPNKTHEEKLTYMTFRVRLQYMDHLSRAEDKHLLFNKYEAYQLFKEEYKRDVILCKSEDDFQLFCDFTRKHPEFVVKPTDMSGGRGVHKASIIGKNEGELWDYYRAMLAESIENQTKFQAGHEKSIVLEELIDQDERMAVFNPASINGVRLPTVRVDGVIHVYQPWFKVGRGGQFVTSSVFGTMLAGIDAETGIVDTPGTTETGEMWECHPDNHEKILGFQIPQWDKLIEFAKQCHEKLPTIGYVGWDFALSKQGWCIMEGNYSGDFMWQVYRHRGMKKDFEDLIGWKLNKQFWWES